MAAMESLKRLKTERCHYPEQLKSACVRDICIPMLTVAQFAIAKTWN